MKAHEKLIFMVIYVGLSELERDQEKFQKEFSPMINNLFGQIKTSDLQEFSAEVTIVISTSLKIIKAEQLFAPSTAHEFRLSAGRAVVRTSPIGEAVLYRVFEFWWAFIQEFSLEPLIKPHISEPW